MDANEALPGETSAAEEQQFYDKAHETKLLPKFNEDDEDVEHHDVGLRRSALNIIFVERGEMFGTAIPLNKDMNETLLQIQRMLAELYAARRQNK
ncbi:MAG: hypothetical protein KGI71_06055 [Patescibacteria group bacterium]|nr:hypothetical protein [Patescibacteria group bacterium]